MIDADPVAEGRRLVAAAEGAGILLRLVGGVAVRIRSPSVARADPPRTYHDIDLAAERRSGPEIVEFLETQGYEPHRRFNTLAGDRLMFFDEGHERRVDVFLDRIEMCHTLDFRDRLGVEPETLPLAELLLSKLQIVKLTERDVIDVAALLSDHRPSENDGGIDVGAIEAVCCADWGWWRTATGNLRRLLDEWRDGGPASGPDLETARTHAAALLDHLVRAPKTFRWRVRARIGERVPWYREPEEVR
jgi:hypothetical protein